MSSNPSAQLPAELLNTMHLQTMFGVTERTIANWVRGGKLPRPFRVGTSSYWDPAEIRSILDLSREPSSPGDFNEPGQSSD